MGEFDSCLAHIADYWKNIICFEPHDTKTLIGLPHHFVSPNDRYFSGDEFYWDSYFIALGMLAQGQEENVHLMKGVAENFAHLQRRFGIIPLRNRFFNLGISQPPFFSSLIQELHTHLKNPLWLKEMVTVLEMELHDYWMKEPHNIKGLSRYCDHHIIHETAEHESGWDMTSRFQARCLHYTPIDLNCLLYAYEKDLSSFYAELGETDTSQYYEEQASKRQALINTYCWNEELGFFYDYKHHSQEQSTFFSLAGYYALWSGVASAQQAHRMKEQLSTFETSYGLANTQRNDLSEEYKQWDYPNGWANQHYIVIQGLRRYGFEEDARRIALKWLGLNKTVFERTGAFWEKYDVVAGDVGKSGRYPTQKGFGWTNGVFVRLVKDFGL